MTPAERTPLGRAIASIRALRGLTVEEFARRCSLSASTISALETGRRTAGGTLVRMIALSIDATPADVAVLAEGLGATGASGADVCYDIEAAGSDGHRAAGLLALHGYALTPEAWSRIAHIVSEDVAARSETVRVAA